MIATDPLSLVFIFCFLLGFGFFIASAFMGGHAHHGHAHVGGHTHVGTHAHTGSHVHAGTHAHTGTHAYTGSTGHANGQAQGQGRTEHQQSTEQGHFSLFAYINPTSVALFLLGFGFSGYFFHTTTPLAATILLVLALIGGLLVSALVLLLLNRIFANSEGSTIQDVSDRTGMIGKVSITIPENGIGEIIYLSPGGLRKSIAARGLDGIRVEREAEVVVLNYQQGVAEVDTWEHFLKNHDEAHHPDATVFDELAQLRSFQNESSILENELSISTDPQKE
jgi:hypothetical protein